MTVATLPAPLRQMPTPDREPPYDDEIGRGATGGMTGVHPLGGADLPVSQMVQGTLALAFVLPSGVIADPVRPPDLRLLPPSAPSDFVDEEEFGPQPTKRGDLPDPASWAGRFGQAVVEVLAGHRPASQLVRWTSHDVYEEVSRRVRPGVPASGRPVVRSVHITEPADGVAEVAALIRRGVRCTAIAFRLEGLDGRWQCTALEVG